METVKEPQQLENNSEPENKTKKKYNYGDRYKGRYKNTLKEIYKRKKETMTEEEKEKLKEYKREHYLKNKAKYLECSKTQNKRVKDALKLLRDVENGKIIPTVNKDILKITI